MKKLGLLGTLLTFCMLISFMNLSDAQAHPVSSHAYGVHKSAAAAIQAHPVLTAVSTTRAGRSDLMSPEQAYPCRNHCHNQHNNNHHNNNHHNNNHHNNNHHNNNHHNNHHNQGYDTTTTTPVTLPSGTATTVARLALSQGDYIVDAIVPVTSTALAIDTTRVTCSFSVANGVTDGLQAATAITSFTVPIGTASETLPLTDSISIFGNGVVSVTCTATNGIPLTTTTVVPAGASITADPVNQLTFVSQ